MTLLLVAALITMSCEGPAGPAGDNVGTISGTVLNSATGKPEAGVKVILDPAIKDLNIVTDASGVFTAQVPIGAYSVKFQKDKFTDASQVFSLAAGQTTAKEVNLEPTAKVTISAGAAMTAAPGSSVVLKPTVTIMDGSTVTGYSWVQRTGAKAEIDKPTAEAITVKLPDAAAYKTALLKGLDYADRTEIVGINPGALAAAQVSTFAVTVTTSSGKYTGTVNVTADLPYDSSLGLRNVPTGVAVLAHGKTQGAYSWTLSAPAGSKAALDNPADQNPVFVPDVAGKYTLTEISSKATLEITAGTWAGAISGQDEKGLPLSASCTACHNGTAAADNFAEWKASTHADIVTFNLATSDHYGENCLKCHTVGFSKLVKNNGFDDADDYAGFLSSGLMTKVGPTNWTQMLAGFPKSAALANIQCENCHGPNNSALHPNGTVDAARIDISAEVCASCHGRPANHDRFQQWLTSGHGDTQLAIDESTRASCARCHTGQGFLIWLDQGKTDLTKQLQGKNGNATAAELAAMIGPAEAITCAVCHDPHRIELRIEGETAMLPSGYKAVEVGAGALCITCHNTRNALHDDGNAPTSFSAPHAAAQGDVLMGQNAYFVNIPARSPHAAIENTCVECHMVASKPPAGFNQNATNHTFSASTESCKDCHAEALDGKAFQAGYEAKIEALGAKMGANLLKQMGDQVTIKDYTPHTYNGKSYGVKSNGLLIDKSNIASIEPTEPHGQQGFLVKFKDPVTFSYNVTGEGAHTMTVKESEFQLGDISGDGGKTPLVPFTDTLVKAGWNYFLLHGDGSLGVHNPAFASAVLDASLNALK